MRSNQISHSSFTKKLPLLSFFTGGGFFDMGFEAAGFPIVWTNEISSIFAEMYAFGLSSWRSSHRYLGRPAAITAIEDIRTLKKPGILKQAFGGMEPQHFGVIGGSPCTDFSISGTNLGSVGLHGQLAGIFFDLIISLHPTFFVFENVFGMCRTSKHRAYLLGLISALRQSGYSVDYRVLDSLDYGIPQHRSRLFVIGIVNDIAIKCNSKLLVPSDSGWFHWPLPSYPNAKQAYSWPTINTSESRPRPPKGIPPELMAISVLGTSNPPSQHPNGDEFFNAYSAKFGTVLEGDTYGRSFKRLHRYRYSPTACYGHGEVHLHPWKPRRLSVRETMRIQSIPDSYILPPHIGLSSKYTMIGNGVPVVLAEQLAGSVVEFLRKGIP